MSDNNLNQVQEIDVLKKKLTLLIKGLKEEKLLTTKLKEENEILKYDLEEKKLLLQKTKEEYHELIQSKISPDKLSTYFNFLENQDNYETIDKEKYKLKKENEEFEKRINILEEEKRNLLAKIDKLEKGNESEIISLKDEISSLKKQLLSYKDSIMQSQEKSSKLIDNIKYEKLINNDRELKITKLQNDNESLTSDNNLLKKQNEYFMNIIEQLKNQIENKSQDFCYLEKEIDDKKIIKINEYTFKGYIHKMSKRLLIDINKINRNISIFFGKKNYKICFEINGKIIDIKIDDIIKMDYYHENNKRIKIIIDGAGRKEIKTALKVNNKENKKNTEDESTDVIFACSFTEKECKYILKFYRDIKNKFNQEKGGFINSINVGILD